MAVRVIDPTPQPEAVKRKTCMSCGVKLEYVEGDVKRGLDRDYTGSEDPYRYIECPNCGKEVRVGW